MVHWFRSYLTDRKQKVIIQPSDAAQNFFWLGNCKSDYHTGNCVIFAFHYINDHPATIITVVQLITFADNSWILQRNASAILFCYPFQFLHTVSMLLFVPHNMCVHHAVSEVFLTLNFQLHFYVFHQLVKSWQHMDIPSSSSSCILYSLCLKSNLNVIRYSHYPTWEANKFLS